MKYTFILILIAVSLLPVSVRADILSATEESGAYTYEFPLNWNDSHLSLASRYRIGSGEASVNAPGPWTLNILNEKSQMLAEYPFNPTTLANGGTFTLVVPIENSGATATFSGPSGTIEFSVDLRWSRVCDDNGSCNASAGETQNNCPTDCGYRTVSEDRTEATAAIADQLSIGARVGYGLMRLGFGAAGIMLLMGVARMLDSRRGA